MFRCPLCRHRTISLLQRIAASDVDYPAICQNCKQRLVIDQNTLGTFAWLEVPALLLIGVLWLISGNLILACSIAAAIAVVMLPASLFLAPLRAAPTPSDYPASLGVVSARKPVIGPVFYVVLLAIAFLILAWGAYVLFPL